MTYKSEIVFIRILVAFGLGIILAYLFADASFIKPTIAITLVLLSYLLLINSFYKKLKAYNFKGFTGVVFIVFCFLNGLYAE